MNTFVRSLLIVRGNEKSLKHFLLDACDGWVSENNRFIIIKRLQYVAGTHKGYILFGHEIPLLNLQNGIVLLPYIQRWYINLNDVKKISKLYNVDFTVFVFENRMENYRRIDVVEGETVNNNIITGKDFLWELLCSNDIGLLGCLNQTFNQTYMTKKENKTPNEFSKVKAPDELRLNGVVPV